MLKNKFNLRQIVYRFTVRGMAGAFIIFILAGCWGQEIKNRDAVGDTIICFGDSITFGYGAGPQEDYPTALAKLVKQSVINSGVSGDTTREALIRLYADVLAKKPRLVIVEFCGNDFLKKVPLETTVKNLGIIIERIQSGGSMVALVDISAGMFFQEYRKVFKKLAAEKRAIFIPSILNRIITNPSMKSDFLHPNGRGYKIVATRIHQAISKYIK